VIVSPDAVLVSTMIAGLPPSPVYPGEELQSVVLVVTSIADNIPDELLTSFTVSPEGRAVQPVAIDPVPDPFTRL
jgi:hypothetical protein